MAFNATGNKDKGSKELTAMPAGMYNVQVEDAEIKASKSSGKQMIEITYRVVDGPDNSPNPREFAKRKLFEYFTDQDFRMGDLYKLGKLCQLSDTDLANINEQEARKDKPGEMTNRIQGGQYFPYSGGPIVPDVAAASTAPTPPPQGTLPFNT
jgi:hypothetical protein